MACNVRVENKRGFESMLRAFRRACNNEVGILHELKKYEYYEKPSDKKRRKIRQAQRERMKAKLERSKGRR